MTRVVVDNVYSIFILILSQWIVFTIGKAQISSISNIATISASETNKEGNANSRKKQLGNFLAGGISGTISCTLTAPLEVIKTQLQSSTVANRLKLKNPSPVAVFQSILRTDGPIGLFKGLKPLLVGIIPTRAIYFWAYSTSKTALAAKFVACSVDSSTNHLLSAFAAGITSNTIMNPLWMVKTRYQIIADKSLGQRNFKNYGEVIRTIFQEEGPKGFFKGLSASYVGCFEGGIQWVVYEKLKLFFLQKNAAAQSASLVTPLSSSSSLKVNTNTRQKTTISSSSLSAVEYFMIAALSKFIAVIATYPHEVVRTRLREQATNGAFKYSGFLQTLRSIAKEEGRRGLYRGMDIHLLRSVPNAAIMFLSFELVNNWLDKQDFLQVADGKLLPLKFKLPVISWPQKNTIQ